MKPAFLIQLMLCLAQSSAFAQDNQTLPEARSEVEVGSPTFVAPSDNLPPSFKLSRSNNNVAIAMHEGRLFMAWRSAPTHFASKTTQMFIMSSPDLGKTWNAEKIIAMGTDVREPFLISVNGQLIFQFFEAGSKPMKFEPKHMYRTVRKSLGQWTDIETFGSPGEIPWELKVRNNLVYMTSYHGDHYSAGRSSIDVHFSVSPDGLNWKPVDPVHPVIYNGGVSEVGFEFTEEGKLFAVARNEDGDRSGFGSLVGTSNHWGEDAWQFPEKSNPNRFDSPRMFRHGKDLYLVARQDVGGPFGERAWRHLPFAMKKWVNLIRYSFRPKKTALYKINQKTNEVEWMADLPSAGDTAFPSIVQLDQDNFLVANYTSPLSRTRYSWLRGQLSKNGTGVYLVNLHFNPQTPVSP